MILLTDRVVAAAVRRMLGHRNTSITESVYAHLLADDLRPAADATAALLASPADGSRPAGGLWSRITARLRRRPPP